MNLKLSSRAVAVFMSAIMTNVPYLAWADALQAPTEMVSTATVVEQMNRSEIEQKVQNFLSQNEVRSEFVKRGVSPDEVTARIASLSDQELKQLSAQMDQAQYGGDALVGILVVVVLVLLIIFLAKRV